MSSGCRIAANFSKRWITRTTNSRPNVATVSWWRNLSAGGDGVEGAVSAQVRWWGNVSVCDDGVEVSVSFMGESQAYRKCRFRVFSIISSRLLLFCRRQLFLRCAHVFSRRDRATHKETHERKNQQPPAARPKHSPTA